MAHEQSGDRLFARNTPSARSRHQHCHRRRGRLGLGATEVKPAGRTLDLHRGFAPCRPMTNRQLEIYVRDWNDMPVAAATMTLTDES